MEALQASALPLGYATLERKLLYTKISHFVKSFKGNKKILLEVLLIKELVTWFLRNFL
jgi:hypothetical protein